MSNSSIPTVTHPDPAPTPPLTGQWMPPELSPLIPELNSHTYRDDEESAIESAGWRVLAATRRGWHHRVDGLFREDSFALARQGVVTVSCVADGLGSAPLSRLGSELMSREVAREVAQALEAMPLADRELLPSKELVLELLTRSLEKVSARLYEVAAQAQRSFKEFRTTLLLAALVERPTHSYLVSAQIGDGTIAVLTQGGEVRLLGGADSGGVGGELTKCMPDSSDVASGLREHFELIGVDDLAAVVLYTDGVEIPFAFHPELVLKQLWEGVSEPSPGFRQQVVQPPVVTDPAPAQALGRWLGFEKRGAGDDRTIVLAHRLPVTQPATSPHRSR